MPASESGGGAPPTPRVMWIATAALILLLHLFRNAIHIADRELWLDEAWTYYIAAQPLLTSLTLPTTLHAQPSLYYATLHFLLEVNTAEWFLRGFSWLAILGLLGFILFFVSELNRLSRVFLCVVLVFHGVTYFLAQELRPYALAALCTFVSTILFARLAERPRWRAATGYCVVTVLALYSLTVVVWSFVCHVLFALAWVVWRCRSGWREALKSELPLIVAVAAVALLYLPYPAVVLPQQATSGAPSLSGTLHDLIHPGYGHELGYFLGTTRPRFLVWAAVLAALLGTYAEIRRGNWTVLVVAAIVVGQAAFVQVLLHGRLTVADRYYSPVFPLFWFAVSLGLNHLSASSPKPVWYAVLLALVYQAWALGVPFVENAMQPVPRVGMRGLHDMLEAIPGRKVVLAHYGFAALMLEYEARDDPSIAVMSKHQQFWAGYPEQIDAEAMDPELMERFIEEEKAADCFFYSRAPFSDPEQSRYPFADPNPVDLHFSVFVPAMERRGFKEIVFVKGFYGFCRP